MVDDDVNGALVATVLRRFGFGATLVGDGARGLERAGEARAEALAAGMDDMLTKPVDPDSLKQVIDRLVGQPG